MLESFFFVSTFRVRYTVVVLCANKCIFATQISAKKCSAIAESPAEKCDYIYGKNCISRTPRFQIFNEAVY